MEEVRSGEYHVVVGIISRLAQPSVDASLPLGPVPNNGVRWDYGWKLIVGP